MPIFGLNLPPDHCVNIERVPLTIGALNSPSLSMFRTFLKLPSKNCEVKISRSKLESNPDEASVKKSRSLCVMSEAPGLTSLYNWYVLTVMTPGVGGMTRVLDSD